LNQLLTGSGATIAAAPFPQPAGRRNKADWQEYYVEQYLTSRPIPGWSQSMPSAWWVNGGGTRPTWDLLCHVEVNAQPGILLVEAKAHQGELHWPGKRLDPSASVLSNQSHAQIARCIVEANSALSRSCGGVFNLSACSHYQLANRMAYAWKLANLGLPVVLMYLGFIGDTYFKGDYIRDDWHWQRVMGGYLQGVIPQQFPEQAHPVGGSGSVRFLVRSYSVQSVSIAPPPRALTNHGIVGVQPDAPS
jgi:hypothetical protein